MDQKKNRVTEAGNGEDASVQMRRKCFPVEDKYATTDSTIQYSGNMQ